MCVNVWRFALSGLIGSRSVSSSTVAPVATVTVAPVEISPGRAVAKLSLSLMEVGGSSIKIE